MDADSSDVTRYTTLLYSLVGIKKKPKNIHFVDGRKRENCTQWQSINIC